MILPLNIANTHWVCGRIDLVRRHVDLYDSNLGPNTNRNILEPLFVMLPYVLQSADFFDARPDVEKGMHPFTHSYVENYPRQENGYAFTGLLYI